MTAQACGDGRWARKHPVMHVTVAKDHEAFLRDRAAEAGKPVSVVLREILDNYTQRENMVAHATA